MALTGLIISAQVISDRLSSHQMSDDDLANAAVKQLFSPNIEEIRSAKENLILLGDKSSKPLINLLEDIVKNGGPRYETGKEVEGAKAIELYRLRSVDSVVSLT